MRKYKLIGLTGQSGSGKSTAAKLFLKHGCAVINADDLSREVMSKDSPCTKLISDYFGADIINTDGEINRKKLGTIVFSDKKSLSLLNSITHPFIIAKTFEYVKHYISESEKYIVFDAPQLFESGADAFCDATVCVTAPYDARVKRIAIRDKIAEEDIKKRFESQYDEEYFTKNCDYTINNVGDISKLESEVIRILQLIKTE